MMHQVSENAEFMAGQLHGIAADRHAGGSHIQRERVLARPGMTAERLDSLLARQTPDAEKRRRADYVVDTGGTIAETQAQIDRIVELLKARTGSAYATYWT